MTTLNFNFNKEYAGALQDLADSEERVSTKLEGNTGLQNSLFDSLEVPIMSSFVATVT